MRTLDLATDPSGSGRGPGPSLPLLVGLNALPFLSVNIFLPSMPGLVDEFRTDIPTIYLALSLYLVGLGIGQLLYGPASDRYGRKRPLLAGLAMFCLGSVLCAAASSVELFLAGRALQALGGASGMVLGRAMIHDVHGPDGSASAIGYMVMASTVGTGLAPALGGFLDGWLGWRSTFVVLTVAGLGLLAASALSAPETKAGSPDSARRRLLVDLKTLLSARGFLRYALYSAFLFAAYYAFVSGSPVVMIGVWRHSPEAFALWWLLGSASYVLGNYLAGLLSRDLGADRMIAIGTQLALGGGALLLILAASGVIHPLSIFIPIGIVFIGNGIAQPSALSRAMDQDPALVGSAAAFVGCMQIAFGIATITLLGALPSVSFLSFSAICAAAICLATFSYVALGGPFRL